MAKTKINRSGDVVVTNRFFIRLKEHGHCDAKGRTVLGIGYSGAKIIAEPDRPIETLLWPLLQELMGYAHYSSDEAAKADMEFLKAAVAGMRLKQK